MTIEQLERRLRLLEQSSKGLDYVRARDAEDAAEDAAKADKVEADKRDAEIAADKATIERLAQQNG